MERNHKSREEKERKDEDTKNLHRRERDRAFPPAEPFRAHRAIFPQFSAVLRFDQASKTGLHDTKT